VKQQYEAYPYPDRSEEEDRERIARQISPLENLQIIDHYLFRGGELRPNPMRILIAGGGTGDACVMLGSQIQELGRRDEIVYVDLSEASREVAERRCRLLGIDNVTFMTGSLLDLAPDHHGTFDYINCSGVLHHLTEPEAGLKALASVLRPGGGMGIMVYGELGRTGIYHVQEVLRGLGGDLPLEKRVPLARALLRDLPGTHWLKKNDALRYFEEMNDAELVDRFLHSCDRAYKIPEVYEFSESAGLRVAGVAPPLLYDPRLYLSSPDLKELVGAYPSRERYAFAELLFGMMDRHSWFATHADTAPTVATISPEAIPRLLGPGGEELADASSARGAITLNLGIATFNLPPLSPPLARILRKIDGNADLQGIHASLAQGEPGLTWAQFAESFHALFEIYGGACLMTLLRR